MGKSLDISEFLCQQREKGFPVVDVRSPGEFRKGHLPAAVNIPLFDNDERAIVGTLYKQEGRQSAFLKGLEIVGPKMRSFVEEATQISQGKKILTYCWRGGMRSHSMAQLWEASGLATSTLIGGYKAFRKHVHASMALPYEFHVIGGPTGSGKTFILHELKKMGEQVVDLEGLAKHKGSAFGGIGEEEQPSTETFENLLWKRLSELDASKRIWVEDESMLIGKIFIPEVFYERMQQSRIFVIQLPLRARLDHLVEIYANYDHQEGKDAIDRIKKRLGSQNQIAAHSAIDQGDYVKAAKICLTYYDKAYAYGLSQKPKDLICKIVLDEANPEKAARILLNKAYQYQPT
ncbi:MAG: tRNA 2-selenouridine(34) synthase MnmH [Bacteroidota bacterium]